MNNALFVASLACLLAAIVVLSRSLPAQNVAFIVGSLIAIELVAEYWCGALNLRNGALFWPGAIILCRTGAKLFLMPFRRNKNYGLFLIGLAGGGAAFLQLFLTPGVLAIGRFCLTAPCLVFLMPWFLQKRVTISEESKR